MNEEPEILNKEENCIARIIDYKGEECFYIDVTELNKRIKENPNLLSKLNYDNGEPFEQIKCVRYKFRRNGEEFKLLISDWKSNLVQDTKD